MKKGKGSNPNSQKNLIAGRNSKKAIPTSLTLSPKARETIAKIGDGNMSKGVESIAKIFEEMSQDKLFCQSPIFSQALHLIEILSIEPNKAEELQPRIAEVLEKMQTLQIEIRR